MFKRRVDIMEKVKPHLSHPDKNTRQAAITLFLNYSIYYLSKEDLEGRSQGIQILSEVSSKETDLHNLLRLATALGNFCHKYEEGVALIMSLGVTFTPMSQVVSSGTPEDEKNKQTIMEIAASLAMA